ncbi:MAG: hypothetical protein GY925_28320 [Actinomycetia bacterium]|nr:hypothetical protein [Actinomycetes bacterium]
MGTRSSIARTSIALRMRRLSILAGLVFVFGACGQESLSLQEYGAEAETLVVVVTARIDRLDSELDAYSSTREGAQTYWSRRLDARVEFLEGLQSLDPPDDAVELHRIVVDLFVRLNAAEQALAARVATLDSGVPPEQWWETPEGQAARAVDEEVTSVCHVAQAEFDKTESGAVFADTPWIPSEMKEVVRVAFGCPE